MHSRIFILFLFFVGFAEIGTFYRNFLLQHSETGCETFTSVCLYLYQFCSYQFHYINTFILWSSSYIWQGESGHPVPPGRVEGNVSVVREVWSSRADHTDSPHCHHDGRIVRPQIQWTPTVSTGYSSHAQYLLVVSGVSAHRYIRPL